MITTRTRAGKGGLVLFVPALLCVAVLDSGVVAADAAAYPQVAARIVGAAQTEGKAFQRLAYLTDRIGPRLSGSAGAARAQSWAVEIFKEDGLSHVRLEKVMVPVWVRGLENAQVTSPSSHPVAVVALGGSVATPPEGLEAEVVEVNSLDELHNLGATVAGRIVLFNRDMGRGQENGYGSVVPMRVNGPREAAKLGAVAMLIRSLGTAAYRLPHTGALRYGDEVTPIPAAAIAEEDGDLIHRLLETGDKVRLRLLLTCENRPETEEGNVVAELPGRDRAGEIVLIGAHLDSWDLGTGALDDGFGVAVVIEAMRLLKTLELHPRRTVRAILFANEENGLAGGRTYARDHAAELDRHVAAIESDSGGAALLGWNVKAGPGGAEMLRHLAGPLAMLGGDTVIEGGGGPDIRPLGNAGVPVIGLRQDSSRYFEYHHTAADTLDKVDPRELAANAAAMAVMAYSLAEWEGTLPRVDPAGQDP